MDTQKKVVAIREGYALKRTVLPTEVPLAFQNVEALIRSLYEPEILAAIEAIQDDTVDD